jgi:hypothetical protein
VLEQTIVAVAVIMAGISDDAVQGHRLRNNNNHTALATRTKTKRRASRSRAAYNVYQTKTLVT